MFDKDFWGEPISIYTDSDAMEDGILSDVSSFGVKFNGLLINRMTAAAASALELNEKDPATIKNNLQFIVDNCTFDGEGADAWGIFQADSRLGNEKLWLIPNETGGITVMLPSDY